MPEDAATRARRYRRHKQGDHSECVAGRCEALGGAAKSLVAANPSLGIPPTVAAISRLKGEADVAPPGVAGRIEELTREFVKTLPYGKDDPRRLLGELAVELARRIDQAGAVPAAVGQLRILLMQLAEVPNGPAGHVDEARVRHHQRQLDAALAVHAAA